MACVVVGDTTAKESFERLEVVSKDRSATVLNRAEIILCKVHARISERTGLSMCQTRVVRRSCGAYGSTRRRTNQSLLAVFRKIASLHTSCSMVCGCSSATLCTPPPIMTSNHLFFLFTIFPVNHLPVHFRCTFFRGIFGHESTSITSSTLGQTPNANIKIFTIGCICH